VQKLWKLKKDNGASSVSRRSAVVF